MDIAGLAFGTIPIAIQLCQYLKKVKDHADDRDKLIENFELYIDYVKQVEEKWKASNIANQAAQHFQQHNYGRVFKRLTDILGDPVLQNFMQKASQAEGTGTDPNLTFSRPPTPGNQSGNLMSGSLTGAEPPAPPQSASKKPRRWFRGKNSHAYPTCSVTPPPGSQSGSSQSVIQPPVQDQGSSKFPLETLVNAKGEK